MYVPTGKPFSVSNMSQNLTLYLSHTTTKVRFSLEAVFFRTSISLYRTTVTELYYYHLVVFH